jgi:adducin
MFHIRANICGELKLVCTIHDMFTIKEAIVHILHSTNLHLGSSSLLKSKHSELFQMLQQLNNTDDEKVISRFALYDNDPMDNEKEFFEYNALDLVRDVLKQNQIVYLCLIPNHSYTINHSPENTNHFTNDDNNGIHKIANGNNNNNNNNNNHYYYYYPVKQYSIENVGKILKNSILNEFSEQERQLRIELAACYRLFDMFGWTDTIYGHLTARVPLQNENPSNHHFLINAFGLLYHEVTASSLIKIDLNGEIIHKGCTGDLFGINRAGYIIHSAIHEARDDIKCVMHCHFAPSSAISCLTEGIISELCQTCQILGDISYHDYEGIAVDKLERERLITDLGKKNKVLILRNHGVVTCGRTVAEAFFLMYTLAEAAKIQINALSASKGNPCLASKETTRKTQEISANFNREGFGTRELCAYMRKLDAIDPSYRL